ncbi:hypothetical protein ACUW6R_001776 [Staphylococcus epidermidis]
MLKLYYKFNFATEPTSAYTEEERQAFLQKMKK